MVTPEAHPFAKTGGLAEVTAALPSALTRQGHDVTVVLPRYRNTAPTTPGGSRCSAGRRSSTPGSKGERPSVIHAHDWQAGLVPVYQKMLFSSTRSSAACRSVFTIHNLAFQGVFPRTPSRCSGCLGRVHVDALEFWGGVSYSKGA
jgi:glycogen synthase